MKNRSAAALELSEERISFFQQLRENLVVKEPTATSKGTDSTPVQACASTCTTTKGKLKAKSSKSLRNASDYTPTYKQNDKAV